MKIVGYIWLMLAMLNVWHFNGNPDTEIICGVVCFVGAEIIKQCKEI